MSGGANEATNHMEMLKNTLEAQSIHFAALDQILMTIFSQKIGTHCPSALSRHSRGWPQTPS